MSSKKRPTISALKHRVVLCSAQDVTIAGTAMVINRAAVTEAWARIEAKRGSFFGRDGTVVDESREKASHTVDIRYRTDLAIRSTAWLYEARLMSEPRWYKVLDVRDFDEDGRFWRFECRLVAASDLQQPPQPSTAQPTPGGAMPLPAGVKL